jgi:hypothetical protein
MRVYAETPLVLFVLIKRPGDLAMHYLCSSLCESVLSSKVCMGEEKSKDKSSVYSKRFLVGCLGVASGCCQHLFLRNRSRTP